MAIVDVVKWNGAPGVFARKFPREDLGTWSQLIVNETQEAVLVKEGRMMGPFKPGRYTLDTKNIPLLSSFLGLATGGRTPFTAEVWFVNRTSKLDVKWGTQSPIQIRDPLYSVMLPVMARGQFGITIDDSKRFLKRLVGTLPDFSEPALKSYFRGVVLTTSKTTIAETMLRRKVSLLEIAAELSELSTAIEASINGRFAEFGIKLSMFQLMSIETDLNDSSVVKLRDALAKKAEFNILGTDYTQSRSLDILQDAAGNEGNAGGVMGAGIGLGLGAGIGNAMAGGMAGVGGQLNPAPSKSTTTECDKCGAPVPGEAKFCPRCGDVVIRCPGCGRDNDENAKSCVGCGRTLERFACVDCGTDLGSALKFCPSCGAKQSKSCASCGADLAAGVKFCGNCGTKQGGTEESAG